MEAGEEEDVQGRPGDKHSRKIYRRCESASGIRRVGSDNKVGEKVSSSNVPAAMEGSKSK